jgi:hypothetical protein
MRIEQMNDLKKTIEDLASDFAMSIIGALRSASLGELIALAGPRARVARVGRPAVAEAGTRRRGRGGRLGRRSASDIGRMIDDIVSLLQQHPGGLRAEQIRKALGVEAKELPRPLTEGVNSGRLRKEGQKRATTYFVGDAAGSGGAPKRRGRGRKRGG